MGSNISHRDLKPHSFRGSCILVYSSNISHRDLKLENSMQDQANNLKFKYIPQGFETN